MTVIAAKPHSGIEPRLVIGASGSRPLTLVEERAVGTYAQADVDSLISELQQAGLRGRGGSGFPAHVKWRAVAGREGRRVVVANGEEGEPASLKDRWLLTHRPHAVIDGLLVAAQAVGASRAIIYLAHPPTVRAVRRALGELPAEISERVEVHAVEHRYVAGEETAVCRSVNGGPALPLAKPPRPDQAGVDRQPTLVSNVETLVHAAWIARFGAPAYRECGTEASPGTALATFGGACARPGVYEVPFGPSLGELAAACAGGFDKGTPGLLMGGWFGGIAGPDALDLPWCYDGLRSAGSCLGCGAVTALGAGESLATAAAELADWYRAQSAGQCGVCVKGTAAIAAALTRLVSDHGQESDLIDLGRWGTSLSGRGACAFLDGAANLARTASRRFEVARQSEQRPGHG